MESYLPPAALAQTRGSSRAPHQSEAPVTPSRGLLEESLSLSVYSGGSTRDLLSHRIQVDGEGYSSKKKQDFEQIDKEKEDEATDHRGAYNLYLTRT